MGNNYLYDNSRNAIVQASSPELGNRPQSIRVEIPVGASQLIQKLKEYNIDFDAHPVARKNIFVTIASNLILPLIFISGLIFFFQNSDNFGGNSGSSPMNLGKSPARFDQRPDTGISFDDIAGIDEAKAEFEEIVSFLKEPDKYTLVGAKIPKGVLLVGRHHVKCFFYQMFTKTLPNFSLSPRAPHVRIAQDALFVTLCHLLARFVTSN